MQIPEHQQYNWHGPHFDHTPLGWGDLNIVRALVSSVDRFFDWLK